VHTKAELLFFFAARLVPGVTFLVGDRPTLHRQRSFQVCLCDRGIRFPYVDWLFQTLALEKFLTTMYRLLFAHFDPRAKLFQTQFT
jgi:hypothetical protein